jgi:hypothetical protein
MRKLIRSAGLALARIFGTRLTDFQTGEPLGKALIIPWRGKIHVIGLEKDVRAIFQPQKRLTYWKQEIIFTTHPSVDFPKEKSTTDQPK